MVTINLKSRRGIHTKRKKEFKHNTKDSHQITRENKNKRRIKRKKERPIKTTPKQLAKWQ